MHSAASLLARGRESFWAQARAADVPGDQPRAHGGASDRGLVLWTLAFTLPLLVVLRLVLPTSTGGWDSELYLAVAKDPLNNPEIVNSPDPLVTTFALRLLVPLIVWALPLDPDLGFHVTSIGGLIGGSTIVALLARRIGVGGLALVTGPVYVLSFHGLYGLWQWRLIDTVTLALFAAAVLAAYTVRAGLCSFLSALTVASKEIGLSLPLAWYAVRRGRGRERRALLETVLVGALPLALFLLMRVVTIVPHQSWEWWTQWKAGVTIYGEWGYPKPLLQVFLQNHGLLWLVWPLALVVAPSRWRRLHLFVLLLVPLLAGGPWARSTAFLLPFVVPSALLGLSRLGSVRALMAVIGSTAVAFPLALRNIGIEEFGSNVLLIPGLLIFLASLVPSLRRLAAPDDHSLQTVTGPNPGAVRRSSG